MPASDFDEFVARRRAQAEGSPPVDWDRRRQEWLEDVQSLYQTVEDFLADYLKDGRIETSRDAITLNEEKLGSYETHKLTLKIGEDSVEFVPIGAIIFGAWGRVDLVGGRGRAKLVLVERKARRTRPKITIVDPAKLAEPYVRPPREEWGWKIAGSPPMMTLTDMTPETLQEAILEVASA